ncbi:MAG: surface-adhesin E family protein [Phenylobacterium sp.]
MGLTRSLRLAAALATLAGMATAAPRPPAVVDPPPPASLEIGDVEAWAASYLHHDHWTLITHDTEGARFTRTEHAMARGPHLIEADIRTELFRPVQMGPGPARSGLARWSVDCASRRYAVLSMTIFSHNNLQGELARKPSADGAWMTPNESQQATISVICKAVLSGKPLERPLPGGHAPS